MSNTESITVEQFRAMNRKKSDIDNFAKLIEKPKRSKYNAQKTVVDEIKFDSKAESRRYTELMAAYKLNLISNPILQYEFEVTAGIKYKCDFMYFDYEKKEFVVEDVKGIKTPEYKLKKKLMKEHLKIEIYETK